MELLYSMRRKPLKCSPPHFENPLDSEVVRPICTISVGNIIAFSSPTELSDADGDTWGGHVYVCDLDTPWDSHKVTSTVYPVSALEWDNEGKQLVVATTVGDVSVYGQKEHLLNDWTCLYSVSLPGEHILKASFFHNGRRLVVVDKKSDIITEKFQLMRSAPTAKGFGGVPSSGVLVVCGSGLAGAAVAGEGKPTLATTGLTPHRGRVTAAAITHKNGMMYIAAVCPSGGRAVVRAARATVTAGSCQLLQLPAFTHEPAVCIAWCGAESDCLLVAGASLTMWKLTERAHPIHKLLAKGPLQGSTTPGGGTKPADCFTTLWWQQVAAWPLEGGRCACVAGSRPALGTSAPLVALGTPAALTLLASDTHHYICSRPVVTSGSGAAEAAGGTPPKKPKYGAGVLPSGAPSAFVSCVEFSSLGGVVAAIDTHAQLHVYRVLDHANPLAIQHITTLLEYSLVSGHDCLDVILTLKPNMVEMLYDRFTESFQRQPQPFQQHYYHAWLKIRTALCRCSLPLSVSASWLSSASMVSAAWSAVCAALRPDDRPDLLLLLEEDHDKSLAALESKPESCGDVSSLQALRRPLQRALDVAAAAIQATQAMQAHPHHGYDLSADPTAISILRKLAIVSRAGGAGPALSRALARIHQGGRHDHAPPEELPPTSVGAWELPPRCAVSAPHQRTHPLYLEYGVEPESLRYAPEPPAHLQGDSTPPLAMDSIRYMYLGGGRSLPRWRGCGRCGARALAAAAKHAAQRAYDDRFARTCRCGGKWTLVTNV